LPIDEASEDQIGFSDGEDRRDKEWKTERHVTFGAKLGQGAVYESVGFKVLPAHAETADSVSA